MIIACDTSSVVCSVALASRGEILFKREASGGQIHIEKLTPFLKEALSYCTSNNISPDALALAIGPGSFNGLRIGLATMKALAMSLELPLIPIPTTDAMAFGLQKMINGPSRAVIFSHRNFVHFADYHLKDEEQVATPKFHYGVWDDLFDEKIDNYFGTADRGFAEWLQGTQGNPVKQKFYPIAADAGQVALLAEMRRDRAVADLDALEPFYNAKYEAKKWVPPSF